MTNSTVWVLGAGFSKPLGGPMLTSLLSAGVLPLIEACFPAARYPHLHTEEARLVRGIFQSGVSAGRWADAEDFLDLLDSTANLESPRRAELERMTGTTGGTEALRIAAKRVIAAECMAFLQGSDPNSERWQPYRRWAAQLQAPGETILTFNYDTVLESLSAAGGTAIHVKLPVPSGNLRWVPALKLHGSTSWRRIRDAERISFEDSKNHHHAIVCPPDEIAIASPGPSKASVTSELQLLWHEAEDALKRADVILFVGYRFPPTDAYSRHRLLDAITRNDRANVSIHIVLGPRRDDDVERLQAMITWALLNGGRRELRTDETMVGSLTGKTYRITVQPLWAQDFFSIYDPRRLRPAAA